MSEIDEKKNPYNFNNKLITRNNLEQIFSDLDINIKPINISLYQNAFVHKSYSQKKNKKEEIIEKPEGAIELWHTDNERLEFLGDSIISSVIARYLYERFENDNEGFLTRIRTKLVNGEALSYFAEELNLNQYILMSRHVEDKCKGRKSVKILEDVFESFIGAIYLDFQNTEIEGYDFLSGIGYHVCEKFIINLIEEKVDFSELISNNTNYKDQLLKYYQKNYCTTPKYKDVTDNTIIYNERIFNIAVLDNNGNIFTIGEGKSKKKAEQHASKLALIKLNEINE